MLAAVTLIIVRRPDSILNAQFWAEDGRFFFADAYNVGGVAPFVRPYSGYLTLAPRALAAIATLFPLGMGPLIMNLGAIVIQALPAVVLASKRMSSAFPNPKVRCALALLYLVGPGVVGELNANATNCQWHLAVLMWCLTVTQTEVRGWRVWRDAAAVAVCALSGPFAILLLPVAVAATWIRARRIFTPANCMLVAGAIIQGAVLVLSGSRAGVHAKMSVASLNTIVACHVFVGGLFGDKGCMSFSNQWFVFASGATTVLGLAATGYAVTKGPSAVRLFIAFAGFVLAASLAPGVSSWDEMAVPECGIRYWFIPTYAVGMIVVWLWGEKSLARRAAGYVAICALAIGIGVNWEQRPLVDLRFGQGASWFESLPPGSMVAFPLNPLVPPGQRPWEMVLRRSKRASGSAPVAQQH